MLTYNYTNSHLQLAPDAQFAFSRSPSLLQHIITKAYAPKNW